MWLLTVRVPPNLCCVVRSFVCVVTLINLVSNGANTKRHIIIVLEYMCAGRRGTQK
jgi:hypothetical protein